MSFTVRSVITEALARANLVARRQPAPGNMVENAYALLKGIAADYSRHNLLQFLRREVVLPTQGIQETQYILGNGYVEGTNFWFVNTDGSDVPPVPSAGIWSMARCWDKANSVWDIYSDPEHAGEGVWRRTNYPDQETAMTHLNGAVVLIREPGVKPLNIIGTTDMDIPNDWVDAVVENIADVKELYWRLTSSPMANTDRPLQFVSYEDFNDSAYGLQVYTWQPISDTKIELKLKPMFLQKFNNATGCELVMVYNVGYSFDLDSVLKIPDIYQELFITALTYKLAVQFPRLSPEHTERLRLTMVDIENSLKTSTRANKFVTRDPSTNNNLCELAQLQSGSFIFPQ